MLCFLQCETILLLVTRSERRSHFMHVLQKLEFSGHDALQMRHQGNVTYRKTGRQNVRCRMRDRMKLES